MKRKETARQRFVRTVLSDRLTDAMARRGVTDSDDEGKRLRAAWHKWAAGQYREARGLGDQGWEG